MQGQFYSSKTCTNGKLVIVRVVRFGFGLAHFLVAAILIAKIIPPTI